MVFIRNTKRKDAIEKMLREAKNGIWMARIAELEKVKRSTIFYYIYGKTDEHGEHGGYFEDVVEVVDEQGNNKLLRWKNV